MLTLLQFRYSPYNEKARWALDFKRVPHERRSLLPGPHMGEVRRRAVLAALLATPGYFARVFGAGKGGITRAGYAAIVPLARPVVKKGNGITGAESIADGERAIEEGLEFVAQRAAATGYLVGGQFTLADLVAAAVLATAVDPPGSPMARPQPMPAQFRAFIARFAGHPGAQWVRDIYARHRGASDDFEGPSPYR